MFVGNGEKDIPSLRNSVTVQSLHPTGEIAIESKDRRDRDNTIQ